MTEPSIEAVQRAYNDVMEKVHRRAFLHKLAQLRPQYGPGTQQDAADLVELGIKLATTCDEPSTRIRNTATSLGQIADNEMSDEARALALELASDPTILAAVAILKRAEKVANQAKSPE